MNLHERLFGRWQDKSIKQFVSFEAPGLYFLNARTFGLKGWLGGTHSWLTHVSYDGSHTVIEVTNFEALHVQKATKIDSFRDSVSQNDQHVIVSNRNGGQLWFGNKPLIITYLGDITLDSILDWVVSYPLLKTSFGILRVNCNTFTSWMLHLLNVKMWTGIGARSQANWQKTTRTVK